MEGSPISRNPESLEDRIRRMALSNTAGRSNNGSDSQPIVRLPSTTSYGPQQQNLTSTFPPNGPGQYFSNQAEANPHGGRFAGPVEYQRHPSHFPSHSSVGHPRQYMPTSDRTTYQGEAASSFGGLANSASFPSPAVPVRGNSSVAGRASSLRGRGGKRQGQHEQIQIDPDAYQRVSHTQTHHMRTQPPQALYDPNQLRFQGRLHWRDIRARQAQYLDDIAATEVPLVEMSDNERSEKESFRRTLEITCHEVCNANPQRLPQVSLECFGSFQSGFASAGSDMDLVIVVKGNYSESACFSLLADDLPRALEQQLLQQGFGARLLTRTRVPIIKVCQKPGASLLDKLRQERENWDFLPNEKKYPHLYNEEDETNDADAQGEHVKDHDVDSITAASHEEGTRKPSDPQPTTAENAQQTEEGGPDSITDRTAASNSVSSTSQQSKQKPWVRERRAGPLDFPKTGVGIQSDINFFNPLGLHNTQMLRCYSLCDRRVRPLILFVKAWAKRRQINSSYSGTLSSYGYVLMVLHYLINVVRPPVLPNLQQPWRPYVGCTPPGASVTEVDGWTVDFWRNEAEIISAEQAGQLTSNSDTIGSLLAGFFHYYSSLSGGHQFRWTTQVLSLRTSQGILTKEEKGWVKAIMEQGEGKKIQHRYLFCIEDPFELSHNVARTVTHHGIVAIRDEFRRAFNILNFVANGARSPLGDLFDRRVEKPTDPELPADLQDKTRDEQRPEYLATHWAQSEQSLKPTPQRPRTTQPQPSQAKLPKGEQEIRAPNPKALDVTDSDAFPTLGAVKTKPRKTQGRTSGDKVNDGEISGERAKALLEEIQRKKSQVQTGTSADSVANVAP